MHGEPPNPWTYSCKTSTREWPRVSMDCCWYCCHQFTSIPVFIPIGWNDRKDMFYLTGNFCSWNCAKSYVIMCRYTAKPSSISWLGLLCKRICFPSKKFEGIRPAPPKEHLQMFGGTLSIDEFRQDSIQIKSYDDIYIKKISRIATLPVPQSTRHEESDAMQEAKPKTNKRVRKYKSITSFNYTSMGTSRIHSELAIEACSCFHTSPFRTVSTRPNTLPCF